MAHRCQICNKNVEKSFICFYKFDLVPNNSNNLNNIINDDNINNDNINIDNFNDDIFNDDNNENGITTQRERQLQQEQQAPVQMWFNS